MIALAQIIGLYERKLAMAKLPTKVKKGIDIGDHYVVEDGKLKPNPAKEHKIPVPAKYARKNKRTWKAAK